MNINSFLQALFVGECWSLICGFSLNTLASLQLGFGSLLCFPTRFLSSLPSFAFIAELEAVEDL